MLRITVAMLFLCGLWLSNMLAEAAPEVLKKQYPRLDKLPPRTSRTLQGGIDKASFIEGLNIFGYSQSRVQLPAQVVAVAGWTPAWRAGLRSGDLLLREQVSSNTANLVVRRDGRDYSCILQVQNPVSQKRGLASEANHAQKHISTDESQSREHFHFVVVIDSSLSMLSNDCPRQRTRWEWCREQTRNLIQDMGDLSKDTVDLIVFNSSHTVYRNCGLQRVGDVFFGTTPEGTTIMADALESALTCVKADIATNKPAIICVITDGNPTDPERVKQVIMEASSQVRDSRLLTISFVEIGQTTDFVKELDETLRFQGAKSDIVNRVTFSAVNEQGLANSLTREVNAARKLPR